MQIQFQDTWIYRFVQKLDLSRKVHEESMTLWLSSPPPAVMDLDNETDKTDNTTGGGGVVEEMNNGGDEDVDDAVSVGSNAELVQQASIDDLLTPEANRQQMYCQNADGIAMDHHRIRGEPSNWWNYQKICCPAGCPASGPGGKSFWLHRSIRPHWPVD
jgi:hypothetical protein